MAAPGHLDPKALAESARGTTGPFQADHAAAVLGANALAVALIFAGWWEASGQSSASAQLGWLNLSLVGLVVAGAANGLWLARGRRAVILARGTVLRYPPATGPGLGVMAPLGGNGRSSAGVLGPSQLMPAPMGSQRVSDVFVAADTMSRYHRAGCLLVAGKEVKVAGRGEHESAGRAACEVCSP